MSKVEMNIKDNQYGGYDCWLRYGVHSNNNLMNEYIPFCEHIVVSESYIEMNTAIEELTVAIRQILNIEPKITQQLMSNSGLVITTLANMHTYSIHLQESEKLKSEGFIIDKLNTQGQEILVIVGADSKGVLNGVFHFIQSIGIGKSIDEFKGIQNPANQLRMMNQWDNASGEIERGYAGKSIFYKDNQLVEDTSRIKDYARLLGSIGINAIAINNVNVHENETKFLTEEYLSKIATFADVFRCYGIKLYLSINFASPIEIGGLSTADPLDEDVKRWWKDTAARIYKHIPDFGGFLVKADSEFRPGPFTYGRNHAQGANMLGEALEAFGGIVIWRCFVYDCQLDWRDRTKDRAKAAYENFKPIDGQFGDNVILQIKNGPMDFQVREPISPLFGALEQTNQVMEFQITQEYTGQQKHVCYLVPLWKETLDFDTYAKGQGSLVSKIVDGTIYGNKYGGIAAVSNIGDDENWTGHLLAQANLYGFGRLAWDPQLTSEEIAKEWIKLTLGLDEQVVDIVADILVNSRDIYENYTAPLGIGWMVYPHHHYGPSVDGYEYTPWGTYHYANFRGLGVDRTIATGTGYTDQYNEPMKSIYESLETCPDELLLFFHNVPYEYILKSGKTVIQHVYDTHFEGWEQVKNMKDQWLSLEGKIEQGLFEQVLNRFEVQLKDAREWRDVINTYFYRRTGILDRKGRKIYE